ncbi:MAG: hypothetical protein K2J51_06730 [Alistipes sp.]|nr:hypothetical protein [Alistipes sp.]
MNIFKIFAIALVGVLTVGCYNDFDTPAPAKIYGDQDMADMGLTPVSIKAVKDKFGPISGTGTNKDWATTKTVKFGTLSSTESATTHITAWPEAANFYIKGKVLSDDREGNIYKSLFIYDGTAAIEVKLTNSNYLKYKQGQWVYIKLDDLYLGNYRMMLSIGEGPTSSYNSMGEEKYYANSNIENPTRLREHVFIGEPDELTANDIVVVTKDNYASFSQNLEANLGRLVRFEGLTCYYAGVNYLDANGATQKNPVLLNGSYEQIYPSWIDTDTRNPVVTKPWYKWAFNHNNVCLYGSVCFTYLDDIATATHYTSDHGIYIVRTSGYSQFAGHATVRNGAKGNITAIFGIYSQQSTFTGGARDYATYQLSVNDYADFEFASEDYLSEDEVKALTPDGYDETGVYNSDNDSYFVPSKNTGDRED